MFTTKLTSLEVPFTRTESPYLRMQMDVYMRKSKLSIVIRQLLGISPPHESTSEKLCELVDSIGLRHETLVRNSLVSGTLRRRAITAYPSLPRPTVKWDTAESKDIISWMKMWHEEIRRDHKEFLELFMSNYNCTRNEAKARTFGMRYGTCGKIRDTGKVSICGNISDYNLNLADLEHKLFGKRADKIIGDELTGTKYL